MAILDFVTNALTSYGLVALKTDAADDAVTDGSAATSTESVFGTPTPSRRIHVTAYSGDTNDPRYDLGKGVAEQRRKDGISDLVFPIMKIEDIHDLLQTYAFLKKLQPEAERERFMVDGGYLVPDDDLGFVRYLSILGHGSAATKNKKAFYSFGETAYIASELGEMRNNGLDLSRYMLDNGKVVLEGCKAAVGEPGRELMFQMGRIFFGKKRGMLVANLGDSMPIAGEIVGGNPRQFLWPKDFADFIPGVLPFGRPL